jgi:hypothetical protein
MVDLYHRQYDLGPEAILTMNICCTLLFLPLGSQFLIFMNSKQYLQTVRPFQYCSLDLD